MARLVHSFDFENAAAEEDGSDDYETEGSEWIGKRVRRTFGRNVVSYGVVEAWLPARKPEHCEKKPSWSETRVVVVVVVVDASRARVSRACLGA